MQTTPDFSPLAGEFLVNGTKCRLQVDGESISWTSLKLARTSSERKTGNKTRQRYQVQEQHQSSGGCPLKRIDFNHVIGINCSPESRANSNLGKKDKSGDRNETVTKSATKLKVYYARDARNKSTGKLLKLKKLTIESISNDPKHTHNQTSKSNLSIKQQTVANATKLRASQSLDERLSSLVIDDNANLYDNKLQQQKTTLPISGPPSCCASDGSTTHLSSGLSTTSSGTQAIMPLVSSRSDHQVAATVAVSSAPCDNDNEKQNCDERSSVSLDELADLIKQTLDIKRQLQWRPKRLLVFVNPYGGKGKATKVFKSRVSKLMDLAQIEVKLVITQHANHARDTIEDPQFNVEYFDGIICIGGDGMFSELMNGLLFRYNRGIGQQFVSPPVPIGVIGAGSTDANSFGLIGTNDVITATLNIILGNQIDIDVCSIHSIQDDRPMRFVSTFVAYGYFGDVVRESERLRWLGPSRYDVTGVNNLIKNRTYQGKVRLWRSKLDGSPMNDERCHADCQQCWSNSKAGKHQDAGAAAVTADDELELVELNGPFVGVNAAVTACRCPKTKKGFSPSNHLANGCADLIVIRPCSRLQYIQYLVRTGWTKKSAFDLKYVEAYRCRQFEFHAQAPSGGLGKGSTSSTSSSSAYSSASSTASSTSVHHSSARSLNQDKANLNSLESTKGGGGGMSSTLSSDISGISSTDTSTSTMSSTKGSYEQYANGSLSSWNVDGEILDEQSIRVKVNNQLLRVYGTGEPLL